MVSARRHIPVFYYFWLASLHCMHLFGLCFAFVFFRTISVCLLVHFFFCFVFVFSNPPLSMFSTPALSLARSLPLRRGSDTANSFAAPVRLGRIWLRFSREAGEFCLRVGWEDSSEEEKASLIFKKKERERERVPPCFFFFLSTLESLWKVGSDVENSTNW